MAASSVNFETLRDALRATSPAPSARERRIEWVGDDRRLAFARNERRQVEIFLLGEPIEARERAVRERLVHDIWHTGAGEHIEAHRLRLPHGDHYDAIAATVLLELLDEGYEEDPGRAFQRTEPLIALVLEPARAENAVLTGLAGELLVLASTIGLGQASPEECLDAWQGWSTSSRDFQIGSVGLEVKTSTTGASRHHVQGWYQIEPGVAADGSVETHLYLLSIGIQWLPAESTGTTIESLAKAILRAVPQYSGLKFIDAVRHYGGANLLVEEDGTAAQLSLRRPFIPLYERLYDLRDERISLPRSPDLAAFTMLVSDSVQFEIELPERVRGDRNPVVGMGDALSTVMAANAH